MIWIIVFAFFMQVCSSTHTVITNQDEVDKGFCHLQDVNLDVDVKCGPHFNVTVAFSVVSSENENNEDELLSCVRQNDHIWMCFPSEVMRGAQNPFKDTLDIRFTFNNSIYGGQFLRIKTVCNHRQRMDHILLKTCISGFSANTTFYNDSYMYIIINCQHSSFNFSLSPIKIKLDGKDEEYGNCFENACHGTLNKCKQIPNGVQCILPHSTGNKYQCVLDGAVFNISEPSMSETTLKSSNVPSTSQPTSPEVLMPTNPSYQDIKVTSSEVSSSASTTVFAEEMATSEENTQITTVSSEIEATSVAPEESKNNPQHDISGEKRTLLKASTSLIIVTCILFLLHIFFYVLF